MIASTNSPEHSATPPEGVVWKGNPALRQFLVPIADLTLDPKQSRHHTARNLEAIAFSLRSYGQQKTISLDHTGKIVLAGNGTVVAASKSLGWTHVAAVPFDSEDHTDEMGWRIADNRSAELAGWNLEALSGNLQELLSLGVDLNAMGWQAHELETLLNADFNPSPRGDLFEGASKTHVPPIRARHEARSAIDAAVARLRERDAVPDLDEGEALARICTEWLATQEAPE